MELEEFGAQLPAGSLEHVTFYLLELGVWRAPPGHVGAVGGPMVALALEPPLFASARELLSQEDAAEIVARASSKLERAKVEGYESSGYAAGGDKDRVQTVHASRNGSVAWLNPIDDGPAVQRLFALGARLLGAGSLNFLEQLQVLRYGPGELYQQHTDFFEYWRYGPQTPARAAVLRRTRKGQANRVATLLWYLSEPPQGGGDTNFPHARPPGPGEAAPLHGVRWGAGAAGEPADFAECGARGASVPARQGHAVLFYSLRANGSLDAQARHAGCPPVREGEAAGAKWAANLWFWNAEVSDWPRELLEHAAEGKTGVLAAEEPAVSVLTVAPERSTAEAERGHSGSSFFRNFIFFEFSNFRIRIPC